MEELFRITLSKDEVSLVFPTLRSMKLLLHVFRKGMLRQLCFCYLWDNTCSLLNPYSC